MQESRQLRIFQVRKQERGEKEVFLCAVARVTVK